MKTSQNGIKFLRQLENCKLKAYPDSKGVWTIGIGSTFYENGEKVKEGDIITQDQADALLSYSLQTIEKELNRLLKLPVNQNQWDALVAHIYNNGIGEFKKSNILKLINQNKLDEVPTHILLYNKVRNKKTGKLEVNKGLINRTKKEVELFLKKVV